MRAMEAGFDEIIVAAINRFAEDKIRQALKQKAIVDKRIRIVSVKGFGG